jgi:hypothetical protein
MQRLAARGCEPPLRRLKARLDLRQHVELLLFLRLLLLPPHTGHGLGEAQRGGRQRQVLSKAYVDLLQRRPGMT